MSVGWMLEAGADVGTGKLVVSMAGAVVSRGVAEDADVMMETWHWVLMTTVQ